MISKTRYWFFIVLVVLVYLIGMFATLFENDSAQFAVMAMRMVQEQDFLNLFKGPEEYLDKPHLHYWLAALSFKLFGLHDWAYRIPGIAATLFAGYSCYGLGRLLYNTHVGRLAALIFMTCQTIVLGAIDVRTDAVLTAFTIFSIWQLVRYIKTTETLAIVLGALGAGLAFSTKGQIALVVIGLAVLCYIGYARRWNAFLSWKVVLALGVFLLATAPMLYAYYHQFDLHPEKVIRGRTGRSGIFFIFWEQSFERLSGSGMGKNSSDYLFFFHTFLWVFLPWTFVGIFGYADRIAFFWKTRFVQEKGKEFLTVGGIGIIFILISFAQFKLPHYLNVTMPLWAVLSAAHLYDQYRNKRERTGAILLNIQYFILGIVFIATAFICFFVFKNTGLSAFVLFVLVAVTIVYYVIKQEGVYQKVVTVGVCSAVLLNVVLNGHFYPRLLEYQAGSAMAQVVTQEQVAVDNIYKISERHSWALDFYNAHPVQITSAVGIDKKKDIWLYVSDQELERLRESGVDWDRQYTVDQFRITRLSLKFLNPKTRKKVLGAMHLVHLH